MGAVTEIIMDYATSFFAATQLSLGILSIIGYFNMFPQANCSNGSPSLEQWIFGTGISYLILGSFGTVLGCIYTCKRSKSPDKPHKAALLMLILFYIISAAYIITWVIIGSISLWKYSGSCIESNFTLWQIAMADIIISYVLFPCIIVFCIYKSKDL
jgi:hypothetical protein